MGVGASLSLSASESSLSKAKLCDLHRIRTKDKVKTTCDGKTQFNQFANVPSVSTMFILRLPRTGHSVYDLSAHISLDPRLRYQGML